MELQNEALQTDRSRLAPQTRVTYRSGVKPWITFCTLIEECPPMMWHSLHCLPTHSQTIALQQRAKRFWAWLHRSYLPSTIITYWSAVLAEHRDFLQGTALKDLGITFPAIKDHIDVFKMQNPKLPPKDNVWTLQHFLDVVETSPDLQRWTCPVQLLQ